MTDDFFREKLSDPIEFIARVLGIKAITREQAEVIRSVWANKYTAVKAAHSVGKTYIEASILLAFLFTQEDSVVVSTAPTGRQVSDLLWRNVNDQYANAQHPLGGKCNSVDLTISPRWFATGISTNPGAEEESAVKMQGYHAPKLLVLVDEAFGVHKKIWESIDGIASSDGARILGVGNPSTSNNHFASHWKSAEWNKITISAYSHPNIILKREVIPGAVSYKWLLEKIEKWCQPVDSKINEYVFEHNGQLYLPNDLFLWKVLGEFPKVSADSLVSPKQVEAAMDRPKHHTLVTRIKHMALDVARFGSDSSVFCLNHNNNFTFQTFFHYDVAQITGESIKRITIDRPTHFAVDCDGIGGGVYDNLWELQQEGKLDWVELIPINSGASPINLGQEEEFLNIRAQMFWAIREDIDSVWLEEVPELLEGLPMIKYFFNSRSYIYIEPKEKFKERVGRSSDHEDAFAYCNFIKRYAILQSENAERMANYQEQESAQSIL